jgi:O-antigen/teichoic acid export membrane protein
MLLKNKLTQSILNWFTKNKATNNELSKILINNILILGLIKPLNIILNFATFTLCIKMVLKADYGLFLTVNSFVSWFSIFDLGIGNGLRNHLTLAIEQKDDLKAQKLVSTAYYYIGLIFTGLLLVFCLVAPFTDWEQLFNTKHPSILILVLITTISFVLRGVLQLVFTVLLAYQSSGLVEGLNVLGQLIQFVILAIVYWGGFQAYFGIVAVSFVMSFVPILVLIGVHLVGFHQKKWMMPNWARIDKNCFSDIFRLGFKFFWIQIAALIIYSMNNFAINKWFTAALVTEYNIAFKYYTISATGIGILLTPYWSILTKAAAQDNFQWIHNLYSKTVWIWLGVSILSILQYSLSHWVYHIWLGDTIHISESLNFACFIYSIVFNWNTIQSTFLNGIGKIRLQLYLASFATLIFYPLAVYLSQEWQAAGIIWATCVCMMLGTVIYPIQLYKLMRESTSSVRTIWNT